MSPAAAKLTAARADVVRLQDGARNAEQQAAALRSDIAAARNAVTARARAQALGQNFGEATKSVDIGDSEARLVGFEEAAIFIRRQLPGAEAAVAAAERALRSEQAEHIQQTILPDLTERAKEAGQVFGVALAELAAAEDKVIALQRRPGDVYATGGAGELLEAMGATGRVNAFCAAGAARTAIDWAGYEEKSATIEAELEEMRS